MPHDRTNTSCTPAWKRAIGVMDACAKARLSWRLGIGLSVLVAVIFLCFALYVGFRVSFDATAGVVRRAAVVSTWMVAGGIGFWWAGKDRRLGADEGILQVLSVHGVSSACAARCGLIVTGLRLTCLMLLATGPVAVASWAMGCAAGYVLLFSVQLLAFIGYCIVAGLMIGAVSYGCAKLPVRYSRLWFVGIVLVPWIMHDVLLPAAGAASSIPSLLNALVTAAMNAGVKL